MNKYELLIKNFDNKKDRILEEVDTNEKLYKKAVLKEILSKLLYILPLLITVSVLGLGFIVLVGAFKIGSIVGVLAIVVERHMLDSKAFSNLFDNVLELSSWADDKVYKRVKEAEKYNQNKQKYTELFKGLNDATTKLKEALESETNNMAGIDELVEYINTLNKDLIEFDPSFEEYKLVDEQIEEDQEDEENKEETVEEYDFEKPEYEDTITEGMSRGRALQAGKPKMKSLRPPKRDKHGKVQ